MVQMSIELVTCMDDLFSWLPPLWDRWGRLNASAQQLTSLKGNRRACVANRPTEQGSHNNGATRKRWWWGRQPGKSEEEGTVWPLFPGWGSPTCQSEASPIPTTELSQPGCVHSESSKRHLFGRIKNYIYSLCMLSSFSKCWFDHL